MSFLKPHLGRRNGHDAEARPARVREAVPTTWLPEAFARSQGVLAAELEHLQDVLMDALADAEAERAELRRRVEALEATLEAARALLARAEGPPP